MAIEKIIHYFYDNIDIWKKGNSNVFRMCYFSWKKFCPDYEIKLWHTNMPEFQNMLKNSKFLQLCYKKKAWALIADYIRHYALYNYGGIYLDTDVQLLKNFDEYLNKDFFISIEGDIYRGKNIPESAVMGGAKGHFVFEQMLAIYNSDEIFNVDYPIDPIALGEFLSKITGFNKISYTNETYENLAQSYYNKNFWITKLNDYNLYKNQQIYENKKYGISIYPSEYFCPSWDTFGERAITEKSVCVHWNQSSWWGMWDFLNYLESYRHKSRLKRVLYRNAKWLAKSFTFLIPDKEIRKNTREKLIEFIKK